MPLREIARAAVAHRANIVALSFSMAFPARRIPALLAQLREMIAAPTQIWVGGSGASRLSGLDGVRTFQRLADCVQVLAAWRNEHA